MKKRAKSEHFRQEVISGSGRLFNYAKNFGIALLIIVATLLTYTVAAGVTVSLSPSAIQPQGSGSGLDADKLQGLSLADVKLSTGWTTSGANIITTAAGNVGIGIPVPLQKLHVNGYIRADSGFCIGNSCITSWSQVG